MTIFGEPTVRDVRDASDRQANRPATTSAPPSQSEDCFGWERLDFTHLVDRKTFESDYPFRQITCSALSDDISRKP